MGSIGFAQDNRTISINTPLGEDALLLMRFSGREGISRLFNFSADCLSEKKAINFSDIVGKKVSVKMLLTDGEKQRYFSGYVSRFGQSSADENLAHYHMEIVPWLWFLTRNANCRIFQNKSIPDIIEQVFKDRGFGPDYKSKLSGTYEPLDYCVQYRETDFNFVSRLMEQYGIYYYFEHTEDDHTLVMADNSTTAEKCPVQSTARFMAEQTKAPEDVITAWQMEQELRTGKCSLTDYNFETPDANMLASEQTVKQVGGNTSYEVFDYPGDYANSQDGKGFAKIRMQEEEAVHLVCTGSGSCRTFAPGYVFDFEDHQIDDMNSSYLLTEVQHSASSGGSFVSGESEPAHYSNHFSCINANSPYRPARLTPKPFVQGPQTAVVVGPGGQEIYVDKYARVKVQFFWDREGNNDDKSSCWIRVSQVWAGANWGAMFIPRIDQEVIVSFLEGDPDRPIITGRVYNADQMPPYTLPANDTQSALKSRSSPGGDATMFNEIRFEDKKGSEQFFVNAQKDMDVNVKNDSREAIAQNRSLSVGKDQMEDVGGDLHTNVAGNINQKAGQNVSLDVGQNLQEKSGQNYAHEAGMEIHLKAGMNVVIEAGMQLTIKAGGNFVNIGPAGVAISGTMVMINSGGAAGSGAGSSPTGPTKPDIADDGSKVGKLR